MESSGEDKIIAADVKGSVGAEVSIILAGLVPAVIYGATIVGPPLKAWLDALSAQILQAQALLALLSKPS